MTSWAEQRRADRVDAREQDRLDRAQAAELALRAQAARRAEREQDRADRAQTWAELSGWLAAHTVELLVYPLALVSAVMAVPAMGRYGHDVYGDVTGYVLPVLSELGAWAFAFAVQTSRRRHPDRPTAMLTAGIGVFGAVAFGLNFAHGAEKSVTAGLVMAVVSVAGLVAHQLAVAAPPRSRAERAAARVARLEHRRVSRARRTAVRRAPVAFDPDGTARLVHLPGIHQPKRRRPAQADGDPTASTEAKILKPPAPDHDRPIGPMPAQPFTEQKPAQAYPTKRAHLYALVAQIGADDPRSHAQLAADLAPLIPLDAGTARRYLSEMADHTAADVTAKATQP